MSNQLRRITVAGNTFTDTAAGTSNGYCIEIRGSVDTGSITHDVLTGNAAPQIVVNGTNFDTSDDRVE